MFSWLLALTLLTAPPRVAMDTSVARVLSEAFVAKETKLACVEGRYDGASNVLFLEKAIIAEKCLSKDLVAMFGFLPPNHSFERYDVQLKMAKILQIREDLMVVGEIHSITRIFAYDSWRLLPLIWWAIREPN